MSLPLGRKETAAESFARTSLTGEVVCLEQTATLDGRTILDRVVGNRTIRLWPQTGKEYTEREDALALCIERSSPPHPGYFVHCNK